MRNLHNFSHFGDGHVPIPKFDYEDTKKASLDYIPGDPEDRYLYVFDPVDESRRVIKRIGEGLSFGWALAYANGKLWRFSLGSGELGDSLDYYQSAHQHCQIDQLPS